MRKLYEREFIVTVVAATIVLVAYLRGEVSVQDAVTLLTVLAGAFSVSRGLAKSGKAGE